MNSKISVVVPTYNSWSTLKLCINSLQKQNLRPSEIIVVDNASIDGTSKYLKKYYPKVRVITLSKNLGVTGGRNTGVKFADKSSKYIFFFDHDMVAKNDLLKNLVSTANLDKKIGIVTPKIYYWTDKKRIWSAGTGMNLWTGQVLFRGGRDVGQYKLEDEVQVAPAAMLVKIEVLRKIKGFDPLYFAVYEDTDFCFRAKRKGYKTYYSPKAIAYHMLSTDPKDEIDRLLSRSYWVGRNRVIFMKRFGKSKIVFLMFLPVFVLYYFSKSITNNRIFDGFKFIQGTIAGFFL